MVWSGDPASEETRPSPTSGCSHFALRALSAESRSCYNETRLAPTHHRVQLLPLETSAPRRKARHRCITGSNTHAHALAHPSLAQPGRSCSSSANFGPACTLATDPAPSRKQSSMEPASRQSTASPCFSLPPRGLSGCQMSHPSSGSSLHHETPSALNLDPGT